MAAITKNTATNFEKLLGKTPTIRVLDFLIENKRDSWSMHEINQEGGVAYPTLKLILPHLMELEIIEVTRQIGKIKFYQLKEDDNRVKKLIALWREATIYMAEKYLKEEALKKE